ncbi:epimerase [Bacterioplanes sanyensis]|uniref:Epimerase n=1 Tax=Bacterioplanes sanyensis TaxID=1249553 RepID=A0A222FK12_9GAMM|nr:NAD-dependent epimerase/dehydratase family protein [Bacterioplanes sanyensis]ASP39120.1 epimerase [Bacterioplanes sanyensis]
MKLLILGGSRFLGKHLADCALQRGHEVTLFNRGQSNPGMFPQAEHLIGDRDQDLSKLTGRYWDAVIDTCGYLPRQVQRTAQLLADQVEHYSFVSTISVYQDTMAENYTESAAIKSVDNVDTHEFSNENYGPLKALCEQAALEAMPGRTAIVRPGLIVGPDDISDRFTYWPLRIERGGTLLAPGRPEAPVQFIDVRDLALWQVMLAEQKTTGVFHATGPSTMMSMQQFLSSVAATLNADIKPVWLEESFLLKNDVAPYTDMPLWIHDAAININTADCQKAYAAGLALRPIEQTVLDTLTWAKNRSNTTLRAGLSAERESQLLHQWHQQPQ